MPPPSSTRTRCSPPSPRRPTPDTPVPTCPGWTLKQLFRHVGRGDRWAATIVRTGQPADPREVADGRPPEGGLVDWLRGGPQAILDAVAEVGSGHRGVDVHRPASRVLVDPPARARGAGAPGRRRARPRGRLRGSRRPRGRRRVRVARPVGGADARPGRSAARRRRHAAPARHGRRTRARGGVARPRRRWAASRGSTGTPRATSPSAARAADLLLALMRRRPCRQRRDDRRRGRSGSTGSPGPASNLRARGQQERERPRGQHQRRRRHQHGGHRARRTARVEQAEEHRAQHRDARGAAELLVRVEHTGRRADQRQRDARERDVEEGRHGEAQPEAAHGERRCERPARHRGACRRRRQQHAPEPGRRPRPCRAAAPCGPGARPAPRPTAPTRRRCPTPRVPARARPAAACSPARAGGRGPAPARARSCPRTAPAPPPCPR